MFVLSWNWICGLAGALIGVAVSGLEWLIGVASTKSANQVELGVLTVLLGILSAWVIRWLRRRMFVEFDRSILVRIEPEKMEPETFANWPIVVGPLPFASFANETVPNVQARDVVGFIVDTPRFLADPEEWGLDGWDAGYFAYGIVHWEHFDEVRALVKRGYWLQRAYLPGEEGTASAVPGSRFLRFVTGAHGQQGVPYTTEGLWASFRVRPYKKLGFGSPDVSYRRLSLQVGCWYWFLEQSGTIVGFAIKSYHLCLALCRWILRPILK